MSTAAFPLGAQDAARLHRDIDAGFLLPTSWYGDETIFKQELKHIHRKAWHFAAHTGELKAPGDVHVMNLAGVPIVLVKGDDQAIRGFINICRHRGHPVVAASGNQLQLRCPFHGWTYHLDGNLRHAPRTNGDPTFDPAEFGLVPIQLHVWGPMIWANLSLDAPSFDAWIAGMPELMASRGLDVSAQVFGFDHTWEINANWKVFQDNTIECYHCPAAHPELARVLEMKPDLQDIKVGGRYWIHHTIPFRKGFDGSTTTRKVEGVPFNYYYHWVFPSTYLQYAGRGFDIGSVDVVGVDRIRFRHIWFMPPDTPDEIVAQGRERLATDATIWQDVGLCNRVQVGHATGMAPTSRILREPEFLLTHFQHVIVDMMGEAAAEKVRMV